MLDLATRLSGITARRGRAPWPDHEYVRGWGVFGLPFDSGHVLALRVFPENSFAPYVTIWHRTPDGAWSIYVDAPRADIACPRYYAAACAHTGLARITVTWTGPTSLRVHMDDPEVEWTLTARSTPLLALANAIAPRMPLATWRSTVLLRARERMARALGIGDLQLSGTMPSGHDGLLMPQQMYFIDESSATWMGEGLGRPTVLPESPTIGGVPLPARGVLAVGRGAWRIKDAAEFARLQAATAPSG